MPLFMDRHDIRDATADAIAAAHQQDLRVQPHHTCKALTYRATRDGILPH